MSEYWGLYCKTCNSSTDHDFNHGEEVLRGLVRATPHIKAALDVDRSGYLEFSLLGHSWSDVVQFAVWDHVGHELELESEYGYTEPIEEQEQEQEIDRLKADKPIELTKEQKEYIQKFEDALEEHYGYGDIGR